MILVGYSGHAFVAYELLRSAGIAVEAYCDTIEKELNPFGLAYLGPESSEKVFAALKEKGFFISVGDNTIRRKIFEELASKGILPINAIHKSSIISPDAGLHANGVMISAGVIINPLAKIGKGAILNTGAIIEHECNVGAFAHIGPGATLCGNVTVGENSFIGAGSVVRQGITIGKNVMVGAGSVVVKDVADASTVMGCPAN